jgi:acetyltransferase-like isoleucine patch superfamily enzyme
MSRFSPTEDKLRQWVGKHRWMLSHAVNMVRCGVHGRSLRLAEGRLRTSGPCSVRGANRVRAGLICLGAPLQFTAPGTWSTLHVDGKLEARGRLRLAAGVEIYVGRDAELTIGAETFVNPHTLIVCRSGIEIGSGCAISWRVQLLDHDRHGLWYDGRVPQQGIRLGNRVWLGTSTTVLPGTFIADGCVVAAGSVVRGTFSEPGCLIGGVPARVLRHDVRWSLDDTPDDIINTAGPAADREPSWR